MNFYDNTTLQVDDVPEHLYIKLLEEYNLDKNNDVVYRVDNKDDDYIDKLKKKKKNF